MTAEIVYLAGQVFVCLASLVVLWIVRLYNKPADLGRAFVTMRKIRKARAVLDEALSEPNERNIRWAITVLDAALSEQAGVLGLSAPGGGTAGGCGWPWRRSRG